MFIETEATHDPEQMKFLPGRAILQAGVESFSEAGEAARSPLAGRLFGVGAVAGVTLGSDFILVAKGPAADWAELRPALLSAILEHFMSGDPVIAAPAAAPDPEIGFDEAAGETIAAIEELIASRVRPAAERGGGDVALRGFKDGVAYLDLQGPAMALKDGIANMIHHFVPGVTGVRDWRDAIPKPGLETPTAQAIQQLLDERINPAVAGHGGHISLVDVKEDVAYIRLEGGCQGCGMADVTLKQGVEVEIKQAVPAISAVLDVTDHAGGNNPYFQQGKGGAAPW